MQTNKIQPFVTKYIKHVIQCSSYLDLPFLTTIVMYCIVTHFHFGQEMKTLNYLIRLCMTACIADSFKVGCKKRYSK